MLKTGSAEASVLIFHFFMCFKEGSLLKGNIFFKIFNHIEESILCCTFTVMTVVCFVQVLTRYIFHYSMPWSEELLRGLFVWSSCLGISLGFRTRSHMGVDAIVGLFPKKLKNIISMVSYLIVIAFCVAIIYYSFGVTYQQFTTGQKTIAMGLPIWIISISLIIGFALTIVRVIQVMIEDAKSKGKDDNTHISEGLL